MIPKKVFFTRGVGSSNDCLGSFELALKDAGIEKCNLVKVSSVFPPKCEVISREEGVSLLQPGQITFCVLARNSSDESDKHLTSAVGLAYPVDRETHGIMWEYESLGEDESKALTHVKKQAASALADSIGIDLEIKSDGIANSSVSKGGVWTTVIAAAVFLLD